MSAAGPATATATATITNSVLLAARVAELGAMRFTPAGLPAIDLLLEHESVLSEAGQTRQVGATVKAVAFGSTAERLATQVLGSAWRFQGFLANARRGKHPVLHIIDFGPEPTHT